MQTVETDEYSGTVKPVYKGHLKIDKIKILMTNGSLIKVKSIAECSHWMILCLENQFVVFCEWPFETGFTVHVYRYNDIL